MFLFLRRPQENCCDAASRLAARLVAREMREVLDCPTQETGIDITSCYIFLHRTTACWWDAASLTLSLSLHATQRRLSADHARPSAARAAFEAACI
jgi:hypothetical protein